MKEPIYILMVILLISNSSSLLAQNINELAKSDIPDQYNYLLLSNQRNIASGVLIGFGALSISIWG